ncbi:hypothetical protein VTI74DRAFT_10878 [Chaetomium olivicolor]
MEFLLTHYSPPLTFGDLIPLQYHATISAGSGVGIWLHRVFHARWHRLIRRLLDTGAHPDAGSPSLPPLTPLTRQVQIACGLDEVSRRGREHLETLELLLRYGADPQVKWVNPRTRQQESPLEWAKKTGKQRVVKLLEKYVEKRRRRRGSGSSGSGLGLSLTVVEVDGWVR